MRYRQVMVNAYFEQTPTPAYLTSIVFILSHIYNKRPVSGICPMSCAGSVFAVTFQALQTI